MINDKMLYWQAMLCGAQNLTLLNQHSQQPSDLGKKISVGA